MSKRTSWRSYCICGAVREGGARAHKCIEIGDSSGAGATLQDPVIGEGGQSCSRGGGGKRADETILCSGPHCG